MYLDIPRTIAWIGAATSCMSIKSWPIVKSNARILKRVVWYGVMLVLVISLAGCGKSTPSSKTYNVSGHIIDNNGNNTEGVTITINPGSLVAQTNTDGKWSITGISGTAIVTPAKQEWTFSPSNRTVSQAATDINFTGTLKQYTLATQINGKGSITRNPNQATYASGTSVTLTAIADEGWAFSRWDGDSTSTSNPNTVVVNQAQSITAIFVQLQYDLDVIVSGEGTVAQDIVTSVKAAFYPHGTTVRLTAHPSDGWRFDHWEGDLEGNENPTTIVLDSERSVKAVFQKVVYTLETVVVSGKGTIERSPNLEEYLPGTEVTLTAVPEEGWVFKEWTGGCLTGRNNPRIVVMNKNKATGAEFIPLLYTLSVNTEGQGIVRINPVLDRYYENQYVSLIAEPKPGWSFSHWTGSISDSSTSTGVYMNSNKTITAVFTQNEYTIKTWAIGDGRIIKSPDQASYHYGTSVQLLAEPYGGRWFSHWNRDVSGSTNPISLTIDKNKTVEAVFRTNSKILFVSDEKGSQDIFVMDTDGKYKTILTLDMTNETRPAWSPDGTKIAFEKSGDIYVMNADGSNQKRLTTDSEVDCSPSWSPDGNMVFASDRSGNREIYTMDSTGSNIQRLTYTSTTNDYPSWSPDGSMIAFSSYKDGQYDIYLMNANGSNQRKIVGVNGNSSRPVWSPDGTKIAFTGRTHVADVYIFWIDTGYLRKVTKGNTDSESYGPSWSPDGTKLVYASEYGNKPKIVISDLFGNRTRLTDTNFSEVSPSWSPF